MPHRHRYTQKPRPLSAYLPALAIGAAFTALSFTLAYLGAAASTPGEHGPLVAGVLAAATSQALAVLGWRDLRPSKG